MPTLIRLLDKAINDLTTACASKHVFIVSYGRSGSTLLQAILNSIPGYQIRGENNDLLSYLFGSWRSLKEAQSRMLHQTAFTSGPNRPWYGIDHAQADIYRTDLTRAFSNAVLRPDPGIRVTGCKEIRYHRAGDDLEAYLDFIHDGFANCRFIFNTRNHDDVLKSGWWPERMKTQPDNTREILHDSDRRYHAYHNTHPDRAIIMHYDDYIRDPTTLHRLFSFLGEDYDHATIDRVMNQRLTH